MPEGAKQYEMPWCKRERIVEAPFCLCLLIITVIRMVVLFVIVLKYYIYHILSKMFSYRNLFFIIINLGC